MVTVRCPQCQRQEQFAYYPGDRETVRIGHDCSALKSKVFRFTFDPPRRAY